MLLSFLSFVINKPFTFGISHFFVKGKCDQEKVFLNHAKVPKFPRNEGMIIRDCHQRIRFSWDEGMSLGIVTIELGMDIRDVITL